MKVECFEGLLILIAVIGYLGGCRAMYQIGEHYRKKDRERAEKDQGDHKRIHH